MATDANNKSDVFVQIDGETDVGAALDYRHVSESRIRSYLNSEDYYTCVYQNQSLDDRKWMCVISGSASTLF